MKKYICHKKVEARSMSSNEYAIFMGKIIEGPDRSGYIVKYEDGYISWSPKKAFEEGYIEL